MALSEICVVEGCGKLPVVLSRGLCRAHYHKWYRYGDPAAPNRRHPTWKGERCKIDGCQNSIRGLGLCDAHKAALKRKQYPKRQKQVEERSKSRYLRQREERLGRPRPNICELCGSPPYGGGPRMRMGICFDHCHATGKPRGWLCDRCNKVLGMVKDSPTLLRKLATYLEEHAT